MKTSPWNAQEEEALLAMLTRGCRFSEIGARLGRTAAACKQKAARLLDKESREALYGDRLKNKKRWTAEEVRAVVEMRNAGKQWKEVAAAVGRPIGSCMEQFYATQRPKPEEGVERRAKLRKCLGCSALFPSSGPGNRICPRCWKKVEELSGGLDEYRLGGYYV